MRTSNNTDNDWPSAYMQLILTSVVPKLIRDPTGIGTIAVITKFEVLEIHSDVRGLRQFIKETKIVAIKQSNIAICFTFLFSTLQIFKRRI